MKERNTIETYKELTDLLREKVDGLERENAAYAENVKELQSKLVDLEAKESARWNAARECNKVGSRGGERFLGEEWREDAKMGDNHFPWRNCCAVPESARRRSDY